MKPSIKPRNPYVAPAMLRKAGSHTKSRKTERRHEQQRLQRSIKNEWADA